MGGLRLDYNPALDGLRAFAVVVVIIYHWNTAAMPGGWIGVDVFFTLSGYLITSLLLSEIAATGAIDLKRFYWRRAVRLMPALLAMLAVIFALAKFGGERITKQTLFAITYTMNWTRAFDIEHGAILGHTWSLAIEEQFYLLWPLALGLILTKRTWRWAAAMLVACLVWRAMLVASGASLTRTYNGFDTHADTLLIGVVLALLPMRPQVSKMLGRFSVLPALALLVSALTLPAVSDAATRPLTQAVFSPLIGLLTAALIVGVQQGGTMKRILSWQAPVFIGQISYALYLWHYPLLQLLPSHTLALGLTIAAALASRYFIELPASRFKYAAPWRSRAGGVLIPTPSGRSG